MLKNGQVASDLDLDGLYSPPAEMIRKAMASRLHPHHCAYLAQATFFSLATGRDAGLDVSPRGGPAGFVHVIDDRTVAFADWPGNNRIESMRNVVQDDRIAMLFIFPGLEVFLRINGRAAISTDKQLLHRLREGERLPKAATVVTIAELIFHCGKAINRAQLWETESRLDRKSVPSIGIILRDLADVADTDVADIDAHYDRDVKTDLY